jgi:S-adenosylmethionine-diacylglycerol 3-amino-3-carboxypropyl transferase
MNPLLSKAARGLKDRFFEAIHGNNLIYNVCWEDPRLDRDLLHIGHADRIAMITSAGCNALDYLLDNPLEIHCIDMNPRQNALLEFKMRVIEHTSHNDLFQFFGNGVHNDARHVYRTKIRPHLSDTARFFWDKKITYFIPGHIKKSFLFRGTSGSLGWLAYLYFKRQKKLSQLVDQLFNANTLEEQAAIYESIEPELWTRLINKVMDHPLTMTLMGVPTAQKKLIDEQYPGGMGQYLKDGFRNVFTRLPIQENYFWYGYRYGRYSKTCCPEYLKEENFDILRTRIGKIHLHTTTFADFLKRSAHPTDIFILLDHQDWMAQHAPEALVMEWTHILEKAAPGARFMMRSAGSSYDFLPFFAHERMVVDSELNKIMHLRDRVGTYASMLTGVLK